MKALIDATTNKLSAMAFLPPLIFRGVLVYGFATPALQKIRNFDEVVTWFGEGLHLPFPTLNAYMAVGTETLGCILLTLGLATRVISIPLIVTMIVAIVTVHAGNGFSCGQNGFEIPLYFICLLVSLIVSGAGKLSLDHLIRSKIAAH